MPKMSGEEVLAILRTSDPQVNVLILSGYSITNERFNGKAEVLHKPLSIKIREVLERYAYFPSPLLYCSPSSRASSQAARSARHAWSIACGISYSV